MSTGLPSVKCLSEVKPHRRPKPQQVTTNLLKPYDTIINQSLCEVSYLGDAVRCGRCYALLTTLRGSGEGKTVVMQLRVTEGHRGMTGHDVSDAGLSWRYYVDSIGVE